VVDPQKTFQTIEGIGGALTDSAAETYAKLPPERQKEVLTAYFDDEKGIGYSFCRTNIHSCDFSGDVYSYDDEAGDTELKSFSIAHDRTYRIPFIKAALATAKTPFKLFASPWSPPAWMKTNGNMLRGGRLKPEFTETWARYYGGFVKAYEREGISIWACRCRTSRWPRSPGSPASTPARKSAISCATTWARLWSGTGCPGSSS
jgi:glucosylceramidase